MGASRSNRAAVNATIRALGDRIGPEHAAQVTLARKLAEILDAALEPHAAMFREYRLALGMLTTVAGEDEDDDEHAAFAAELARAMTNGSSGAY